MSDISLRAARKRSLYLSAMRKIKALLLFGGLCCSLSGHAFQSPGTSPNDLRSAQLPAISYPAMALAAHVSGDVAVEIALKADGTASSIKVLSGPAMLQQAAIEIAKQTRFECAHCSEPTTSSRIIYRFVLGEARPCEGADEHYLQAVQSANMVTITERPFGTCDPSSVIEQQPADVVRKLYREVVTRHPLGVPYGASRAAIWPLLSKRLVRVFETRNACDRDWGRQHPNANVPPFILKPPGFYEDGLFSGPDELGYINGAAVGTTKRQADGSYLVYVSVWSYYDMGEPSLRTSKIYRWRVAARVVSENGKFAVDDILGFKGVFSREKAVYMSKMLSNGCKGSHAISN